MKKWYKICNDNGHFDNPMDAPRYMPLLSDSGIFSGYTKGNLPDGILTLDSLKNLRNHQSDNQIKFKSDFADFLLGLLD
ncbi:MAG: hypothetical protein LBL75_00390 [Rickettsiales bacterium]|nr:hypothetical protein [Rickettsiales bacterium]